MREIGAIAPSNIPRPETTARIPHLSSELSKFVGKNVRLRFLEKIFSGDEIIPRLQEGEEREVEGEGEEEGEEEEEEEEEEKKKCDVWNVDC